MALIKKESLGTTAVNGRSNDCDGMDSIVGLFVLCFKWLSEFWPSFSD